MEPKKKAVAVYTSLESIRAHLFVVPNPAAAAIMNISNPELAGATMAERTLSKLIP